MGDSGVGAVSTAQEAIEAEVRDRVRSRGIDPIAEPDTVASLVDEVVGGYLDRAVSTPLPPLGDVTSVSREVLDAVAGFGPLQRLLDDPSVEEIWVNEPGRLFVARRGRPELTNVILSSAQLRDLVERMLATTGRRIDLSTPFVDAALPDGSRLHVVLPSITRRHLAVNIRKFVLGPASLDELISLGTLTPHAAAFLEASMIAGLNALIAGGTQAGKTTLLNALCRAIPARERIVTVEEVFELQIGQPDVVAMQTRQANLEGAGEITLRRLITEALRMRPSRLIIGEVRQAEALDLLIALNSGLPGACSIHANSAREALIKLCTLPLLAGPNISPAFVVPTVASSVDIVVHTALDADGRRRVREILAVTGRVEGDVIETSELFVTEGGRLARGSGYPPHPERYEAAGVDLARVLGGLHAVGEA